VPEGQDNIAGAWLCFGIDDHAVTVAVAGSLDQIGLEVPAFRAPPVLQLALNVDADVLVQDLIDIDLDTVAGVARLMSLHCWTGLMAGGAHRRSPKSGLALDRQTWRPRTGPFLSPLLSLLAFFSWPRVRRGRAIGVRARTASNETGVRSR
jgi:hypothetical protein